MTDYRTDLFNIATEKNSKDREKHLEALERYVDRAILTPCIASARNGKFDRKFKKAEIETEFTYEEVAENLTSKNLTVTDTDKYFPNEFTVCWDKIDD